MTTLRCDSSTVEAARQLKEQCANINGDGLPGVEIRAAAPKQQNQNPVERHIQAVDNQIKAIMMDQDLLTTAW